MKKMINMKHIEGLIYENTLELTETGPKQRNTEYPLKSRLT